MSDEPSVPVWDPFVRIFHWSLVIAFSIAYLTEEDWLKIHVTAGYTVAGLLIFRIIWGVVGPRHARFADFMYRPRVVWLDLKELVRLKPRRCIGHNPAGGAMVIMLLILLTGTVVSGFAVYAADEAAGPFAAWLGNVGKAQEHDLEELHELLANLTLMLVGLHVGGVLLDSFLLGENLTKAMITGRKSLGDNR